MPVSSEKSKHSSGILFFFKNNIQVAQFFMAFYLHEIFKKYLMHAFLLVSNTAEGSNEGAWKWNKMGVFKKIT